MLTDAAIAAIDAQKKRKFVKPLMATPSPHVKTNSARAAWQRLWPHVGADAARRRSTRKPCGTSSWAFSTIHAPTVRQGAINALGRTEVARLCRRLGKCGAHRA